MKNTFFIVFLLSFLLPNCKKEQIIIQTPIPVDTVKHIIELNQGTVLNNAVPWNATFISYYYGFGSKSKFQLRMKKSLSNGLKESLFIQDIPGRLGTYPIKFGHSTPEYNDGIPDSAYGISNYDEGLGNFYPDTTRSDNFIEVLRYDTLTNEVEGRFQVFMGLRFGPSTLPGVPDSVFLTEGKFYLKIQ